MGLMFLIMVMSLCSDKATSMVGLGLRFLIMFTSLCRDKATSIVGLGLRLLIMFTLLCRDKFADKATSMVGLGLSFLIMFTSLCPDKATSMVGPVFFFVSVQRNQHFPGTHNFTSCLYDNSVFHCFQPWEFYVPHNVSDLSNFEKNSSAQF